jgi:hypothetical protein
VAWAAYARFLEDPRQLWTCGPHDRNAHYLFGLNVALDLRKGDVLGLLHDLDGARVWGPLHGVVAGLILAVGGPDYRLAVLPSLMAWLGTAIVAFLLARRVVPQGGNLAGAAAALLVLASPAYRAFATDIMLESSGAFLTLLVLYLYVVTKQSASVGAARGLALALTALFLLKYNYWLLAIGPLVIVEVAALGKSGWRACMQWLAALPWWSWLRVQWRHPLNYVLVAALALWAGVAFSNRESMTIAGHTILLRSPDNIASIAYVVLFLRAAPWWWRQGRAWARQLSYPLPYLLAWHALPVALWFLMPKRPSYFFWYMTRDHGGEAQHNALAAAGYYWHCLVTDYHLGLASLLIVIGLIALARFGWRNLKPGGVAVLVFVLLAAFIAVRYPSHRSRFLHSWLASWWVVAGIGAAQFAYGSWARALGAARHGVAVALAVGLALLHVPGMFQPGHALEGGPKPEAACNLDVTDEYLTHLADAHRPVLLSNAPIKQLMNWTYLQRYGRKTPVECDLPRLPAAQSFPESFDAWLQKSSRDVVVFVDVQPGSPLYEPAERPEVEQVPGVLASDPDFHIVQRREFPEMGCTVTMWKRQSDVTLRR